MQLRHKFLVGMCASLLTLALFGFGLFGSIYMVAGKSGPIKGALRESGIYQTGIGDALDQAQKDHPSQNNDAIPTDKPEVRNIIKQAFPPAYVQGQSEHALDATYAWLQGKTPRLAFSIDLTDAKTRLADGMAAYVQHRIDMLPVCTAATMPSGGVDAFNAACLPPGFDKAGAVTKARDDVVNGDFLKDSKFDADTVKSSNGKTLSQQLQAVPKVYQYVLLSIAMLGGSSLLLGAGVVLLGGNWRAGLRRLGVITAVVGAFTAALGWTSSFVIHKATIEFAKSESGSQPLQQKVMRIVELLINDLRGLLVSYGIALVVLGAAAIVAWYFLRRSGSVAEALAGDREPIKTTEVERLPAPKAGRAGAKPKLPEIKK
ncbi:MAG TPA: hypothetical protein VGO07_01055 [Candidatus Saccharimonadales bacterium]|jgi:hypothetical protein|nr:hypothetical protein [Candidatus Saccharimonadales bacterium]